MVKRLCIIGAALNLGQRKLGLEIGPSALRHGGIVSALKKNGFKVEDCGDLTCPNQNRIQLSVDNTEKVKHNMSFNKRLCEKVKTIYDREGLTLTLGGDHSVSVGSIAGILSRVPNLGVIWMSAHSDLKTLESSEKMDLNRMPLSYLTKMADIEENGAEWLKKIPRLPMKNFMHFGLRRHDRREEEILERHKVMCFYSESGDIRDIEEKFHDAMDYLSHCMAIHVSFSVDALEPALAPSLDRGFPYGMTMKEAKTVIKMAYDTGLMTSMDIVELNPNNSEKEKVDKTVKSVLEIISALGRNEFD